MTAALASALRGVGVDPPDEIPLERPARREHGDWSSTVALAVAKRAGRKPRELAEALADALPGQPPGPRHGRGARRAGLRQLPPGAHVAARCAARRRRRRRRRLRPPDLGRGRSVNVEFVSANPTGPLHAGHGRNAAYGDAAARLLQRAGWKVQREYYLNDRGTQMELFAASLVARKRGEPLPEGGYAGEYIAEWAAELPDGADPLEWGRQRAIDDHRATLARMRVHFDRWFSERSMVASARSGDARRPAGQRRRLRG